MKVLMKKLFSFRAVSYFVLAIIKKVKVEEKSDEGRMHRFLFVVKAFETKASL